MTYQGSSLLPAQRHPCSVKGCKPEQLRGLLGGQELVGIGPGLLHEHSGTGRFDAQAQRRRSELPRRPSRPAARDIFSRIIDLR
jgi:hypothetical protein